MKRISCGNPVCFFPVVPFFLLILLVSAFKARSQHSLEFSGYLKQLATFGNINPDYIPDDPLFKPFLPLFPESSVNNQFHNRFNLTWKAPDHFSGSVSMRNRLFWGYQVESYAENKDLYQFLGIESFNELIDFPTYFNLSITWWENSSTVMHSVFDRFWVQYENEKWRMRAGRQRINWGINNTFNPNDLFNQYNFFDFDYEERPGSDALLVQHYINEMSSLEAAFTPGVDSWDQSVGALLYRLNKWQYDWQILSGYFRNDWVTGFGWAGNVGNAGFKGEMSYFVPLSDQTEQSFVASLSADYVFSNAQYLMAGFMYNQLGTVDPSLLDQATLAGANLSAKNIFPYRYTLMLSTGYNLTALLRADLSWLQTPDFANAFAVPTLTYSVVENLDFLLLGQIYFAKNPNTDQFGFFSSSIFTRIKYSF